MPEGQTLNYKVNNMEPGSLSGPCTLETICTQL